MAETRSSVRAVNRPQSGSARVTLAVVLGGLSLVAIAGAILITTGSHPAQRTSETPASVSSSGAGADAARTGGSVVDLAHRAIRQRADALSVDYTSSFCDRIPPDDVAATVKLEKELSPTDTKVRLFRCHLADQSAGDGDFKATGFGAIPGTTCIVAVLADRTTDVTDCE